jgi:diguanylate cyclase (GGDEF)-like protein/PAS domain S-box-containing protein
MIDFQPTILIVDDMQTNLALLAGILKNEYHIKIAKSGKKAIELVSHGDIDLILLDVVMPDMDGYEVCSLLKKDEKTKDIPVIFVTGNTSNEDEEKGFTLGAVDYIGKPIKPTTVRSRVKTHINLYLRKIELETMSEAMQEQNEKLKRYTTLIDQNVITSSTDLKGVITEVSSAFCQISGYSKEELIGQKHSIVRHPDFPDSFYEELWKTILQDKVWSGEIKNLKKDGNFYWVKASISPIFEKREKIGYTAIRQDITDKKFIEEISITDGLTDIFNRRHFNETFPNIINSATRTDELLSFLLMDIDHFKQYNDNYGHQAGDDVLIKFAQCMKDSLQRADDLAFRLGGEEFGVVFKTDTKEKAIEFANKLRTDIENLHMIHAHSSASKYITASMGLVCKNASKIKDMDEVYKQADELLYESKESGRNKVSVNEV